MMINFYYYHYNSCTSADSEYIHAYFKFFFSYDCGVKMLLLFERQLLANIYIYILKYVVFIFLSIHITDAATAIIPNGWCAFFFHSLFSIYHQTIFYLTLLLLLSQWLSKVIVVTIQQCLMNMNTHQ